ncbi:sterol carrier family protein [Bifidobacterium amazonense]|uniref:Sterol carrier family protein n=1 Tax=Bifidobacterium amazonense TaxID=2809027 RepID=A0ABS9VYD6_9BIFI|nr:sterol carrier family protein [Bifidobacterium amazonense]MCH9277128.1 sterol carrier family protein [Bifidobacterium amazonense]
MAVIREQDIEKGRRAWRQWVEAAREQSVAATTDSRTAIGHDAAGAGGAAAADASATAGGLRDDKATSCGPDTDHTLSISPELPRPVWAMSVRYTLFLLERRAPGPGVEVRVAPWGAIKILDGPASDPHNLTPPDVIELEPDVWLRLAAGITTWAQEKDAGHITAVGERDDLSDLLPL